MLNADILIQLSILILAALTISFIARLLKQPMIIAYIITGILVSSFLAENTTIVTFSQLGVTFLLFIVGLHLNPRVIKEVGFISLVVGSIQVTLTALLGFLLSVYVLALVIMLVSGARRISLTMLV